MFCPGQKFNFRPRPGSVPANFLNFCPRPGSVPAKNFDFRPGPESVPGQNVKTRSRPIQNVSRDNPNSRIISIVQFLSTTGNKGHGTVNLETEIIFTAFKYLYSRRSIWVNKATNEFCSVEGCLAFFNSMCNSGPVCACKVMQTVSALRRFLSAVIVLLVRENRRSTENAD